MLQNKKKYREKLRLEGPNLTLSNKLFFFFTLLMPRIFVDFQIHRFERKQSHCKTVKGREN